MTESTNDENVTIIKRYSNRRLYDTGTSCYINLEKIAELVANDQRFKVVDTTTGDDVTPLILSQIILEREKEQGSGLPVELLFQLVRKSSSSYLSAVEEVFSLGPKAYGKAAERVKSVLSKAGAAEKPVEQEEDEMTALKERLTAVEALLKETQKK